MRRSTRVGQRIQMKSKTSPLGVSRDCPDQSAQRPMVVECHNGASTTLATSTTELLMFL